MSKLNYINKIICGDNLTILKTIPNESIDLIYIDPPFKTNKDWGEFDDRFQSIEEYLIFMQPRVNQIYRVLKKTGSFYLHCDKHASHYLKVMCDEVFGYKNFRNEIIWKRATGKSAATKKYDVVSDTILFYTKSSKYFFEKPLTTHVAKTAKEYKKEGDRYYKWENLTAPRTKNRFEWKGTTPSAKRQWAYTKENLEQFYKEGLIRTNKDGKIMMRGLKKYVDKIPLVYANTIWDDIQPIVGGAKERLGYPTQKPEALLERIIKASSKPNDIVLDCFCGSGTTLSVAKRLGRKWIGIDNNPKACAIARTRIMNIKK